MLAVSHLCEPPVPILFVANSIFLPVGILAIILVIYTLRLEVFVPKFRPPLPGDAAPLVRISTTVLLSLGALDNPVRVTVTVPLLLLLYTFMLFNPFLNSGSR